MSGVDGPADAPSVVAAPDAAVLALRGIARAYRAGSGPLHVLRNAELALNPGDLVALVAPSGAGKSTLLHIAGLLERPDAGEVLVGGEPTSTLSDDRRTALRRTEI